MRDEAYIAMRKQENDAMWREREKCLYYSYKNPDTILITIILCCLVVFVRGGISAVPIIAFGGYVKCRLNNNDLDNSPNIQLEREMFKKYILNNRK